MNASNFNNLVDFLRRIPAVKKAIGTGTYNDGNWWIKFSFDINHNLAWNAVQEIGHVLNYLSIEEKLPTRFYPVSAPPYLNGGPEDYLCWIIESTNASFSPDSAFEWLEGRLPRPVDNIELWKIE